MHTINIVYRTVDRNLLCLGCGQRRNRMLAVRTTVHIVLGVLFAQHFSHSIANPFSNAILEGRFHFRAELDDVA